MKNFTIAAAIIATAVIATMTLRVLFPPEALAERSPAPAGMLKGEIVSIDDVRPGKRGEQLKRLGVKLETGETVRLSVPANCEVYLGQVTRLAKSGDGKYELANQGLPVARR